MSGADRTTGYFGKIATHGDFIARGLPPGFLFAWDGWLQRCLQKSQEQLGYAWRDLYPASPAWRFALAAGVCGDQAWAGLLLPSADRVGRHFPWTVARALPSTTAPVLCLRDAAAWYDAVQVLALDLLAARADLAAFDARLADLPEWRLGEQPGAMPLPAKMPAARNCLPSGAADAAPISAVLALGPSMNSLWWGSGSVHVEPGVLACEGLPAPANFAALLDGNWAARGWQLHRPACQARCDCEPGTDHG